VQTPGVLHHPSAKELAPLTQQLTAALQGLPKDAKLLHQPHMMPSRQKKQTKFPKMMTTLTKK
jgi:hypothetical protein